MVFKQDAGFVWIYGLIVAFVVGVIEVLIMPTIDMLVKPAFIDTAESGLSPELFGIVEAGINSTMLKIRLVGYVILFGIFVYLLLTTFKREEREFVV